MLLTRNENKKSTKLNKKRNKERKKDSSAHIITGIKMNKKKILI